MTYVTLWFLVASSSFTANRRINTCTTFLKLFIALFLASTLSANPAPARATELEHKSGTLFRAGDTTHIVENIPSISALAWDAAFWASLNTIPDIISYVALQVLLYKNRPLQGRLQETPAAQWLLSLANFARHVTDGYKLASLGDFAFRKAKPVVNQTHRRTSCLRKTGSIPVYIMDIPLARAFTIELQLNDPDKPYVVFHALNTDIQETGHKLPRAWQRLFDLLHKLHEPALYASIQKTGQSTILCLSTVSGYDCQLSLPVKTPDQNAYSWDIEMAGQWCPQTTLKTPEQGYSFFSTAVIDAMANALMAPDRAWSLPPQSPGKILWQGNSAIIEPAMASDYQVGWSGTAINPGSGGFITLASHKAPRLTPENMEHIFSNWQYWMNSYQKHWSATPLYWLTTLSTNKASLALRQHIHRSSMALIHERSRVPRHPPIAITGTEKPGSGLSGQDGNPAKTPDTQPLATSLTPGQLAIATTTNPLIYRPDYSSWGFKNNGQVLVARTIALSLSSMKREEGYYRSKAEIEYLQLEQPGPKPATLILPGAPINLHLYNYDLILLISVPSSRALAPYKGNVNSNAGKALDDYRYKRHPGVESLTQKLYEMNLRRYPLLTDQSWGHIAENGKPATKPRTSTFGKYYKPILPENELILSHYTKEDIKGIIITDDTPLLLQSDRHPDLMTTLELKQVLEKELQLDPLPIFLYSQKTGRITDTALITPNELLTLAKNLKTLSSLFLLFNMHITKLPAFLGTLSLRSYLGPATQKAKSFSEIPSGDLLKQLVIDDKISKTFMEKIIEGNRDNLFFLELAQRREWLMLPRTAPLELKNLGGPTSSRFVSTPLRMIAYVTQGKVASAGPDQLIKAFQDRSRLVDQIINNAGLTEQFSHRPLSHLDIFLNPYAAINWINRGCPVEGSAVQCLKSALEIMHLLKSSDGLREKYFDDVIIPLFRKLLTTGKLNKPSLQHLILVTINTLERNLFNYAMSNIERASLEHRESIAQLLLLQQQFDKSSRVISTEQPTDKVEETVDEMERNYNSLAILSYLDKITYGEPGESKNMIMITSLEQLLHILPATIEGTPLNEIPNKAFYPIKKDSYSKFLDDSQLSMITAVIKTMVSPDQIAFSYLEAIKTPGDQVYFLGILAIMAENMSSSKNKKISSMLPLVIKQEEWEEISKSYVQSAEHSNDMKLAMTRPYPLAPTMTAPLDKQLQQVIEHYYQNPSPAQINSILGGTIAYDPDTLWRDHHGVDHVVRTAIILEATIQFHKELRQEYVELFKTHHHLDRLLSLAMVYHDVGAEIIEKDLEELLASQILEQDLKGTGLPAETIELVVSALKNKNVNTMNPVPDGYTPDDMASHDEQLIRRLLRIPDSVDIARVRTVSDEISFATPSEIPEEPIDENIYSMRWMGLDPDMLSSPELMEDWVALMKTSVFWASLTGASPRYLIHSDPATLMPYTVNPNLVAWTDEISQQRKLVITRTPDSLNYAREILHDIVRMFITQEAGKTVSNVYQLRQIRLPEDWSTLDSFLHFTEARKAKLQPVIDFWKGSDFTPHHGTLTGDLLSHQAVIDALPPFLSVEKVKRQRGYEPRAGKPIFEETWELTTTRPPEYGSP